MHRLTFKYATMSGQIKEGIKTDITDCYFVVFILLQK